MTGRCKLSLIFCLIGSLNGARLQGQANPVACWGHNSTGQLGDNSAVNRTTAVPPFFLSGVKQVSAGGSHTLALMSNGQVYGWGANFSGQLGQGDTVGRPTPTRIPGVAHIIAISAGADHSLALRDDGRVFAWGAGGNGQLGLGDNSGRLSPTLTSLTDITAIAAGGSHSMALTDEGAVYMAGDNFYGQLGLNDNSDRVTWTLNGSVLVKAIAAGAFHSVVLDAAGSVSVAGENSKGQLGFDPGSVASANTFVKPQIGYVRSIGSGSAASHTLAVQANGGVVGWGNNAFGQLGDGTTVNRYLEVQMLDVQYAKAVSCGATHSVVLLADGTALAVGRNTLGQLGDGTAISRTRVVKVLGSGLWDGISAGGNHSAGLKCFNAARAWGYGGEGQLGNGLKVNKTAPVIMSSLSTSVLAVSTGYTHTLALKADGTVFASGDNYYGQLGLGTTVDQVKSVKVPGLSRVIAISAGYNHSLAITADGLLWAWGNNNAGQLGTGDFAARYSPVIVDWGYVSVEAGSFHSLAVAVDGSAWTWGASPGSQQYLSVPTRVPAVGAARNAVSAGEGFDMLLTGQGWSVNWGSNSFGQLGLGTNSYQQVPTAVPGVVAKEISAGHFYSAYLSASGTVFTSGVNTYGQLGDGSTTDRTSYGGVYSPLASIGVSAHHMGGFDGAGNLMMWGYNSFGAVGDGTTVTRHSPKLIGSHPFTTALAHGSQAFHSVALSNKPIMLSSLKLSATSVIGGSAVTGTVTLSAVAGAGGLTVVLFSSNPSVATVPASVVVPAGAKFVTFPITTAAVAATKKVVITASWVATKTATLTVNP